MLFFCSFHCIQEERKRGWRSMGQHHPCLYSCGDRATRLFHAVFVLLPSSPSFCCMDVIFEPQSRLLTLPLLHYLEPLHQFSFFHKPRFPSGKMVGLYTDLGAVNAVIRDTGAFLCSKHGSRPGTRGAVVRPSATILKLDKGALIYNPPVGWANTNLSVSRYLSLLGGLYVHSRYLLGKGWGCS